MKMLKALVLFICCAGILAACASKPEPLFPRSQWRPIEALPTEVFADSLTVTKFREVSDVLARDLVIQPFVTQASKPPVIAIRKLENKTNLPIDDTIFQETIRVKLMQHAGGTVLFRDDVSYRDIIKERTQQTGGDVTVTLTDSVVQTKTKDHLNEREYEAGALSGQGGAFEQAENVEDESNMQMEQTGTVKGKVADADYFLRGIIYQMDERNAASQVPGGMTYFQYQFRVVDARSGLIVWEKMLDSKMEGPYTASLVQAKPAAQAQGTGQVPAGWPTTPQASGGTPATQTQTGTQPAQGQTPVQPGTQAAAQQPQQQGSIPSWP